MKQAQHQYDGGDHEIGAKPERAERQHNGGRERGQARPTSKQERHHPCCSGQERDEGRESNERTRDSGDPPADSRYGGQQCPTKVVTAITLEKCPSR